MNWIVSTNDLDASVVRHILNILEKERDELAQVNDVARQIDLTRLQSAPIPRRSAGSETACSRHRSLSRAWGCDPHTGNDSGSRNARECSSSSMLRPVTIMIVAPFGLPIWASDASPAAAAPSARIPTE